MSYPEKYNENLKMWRLETLPFIPNEYLYEVIPAVEKQFNIVKSLLTREDVDTIYVCTDSGREGEYIYRLVDQMIGVNGKNKKRVWIDSQTEEEILRGIKEAKDLSEYDSLSDSAYLRAKEDYLIGINFSRLLSIIYGRRVAKDIGEERLGISVGRVMTCVLGMVVERELEIRNFVKTKYYKILATLGSADSKFDAEWKVCEKSKVYNSNRLYNENGFKEKEIAEKFVETLKDKEATITDIKKTKQKENAPLLFNLAELQNECTKRFKIKPDETLEIVQSLYEKKLVTYPRTDARVLSTAVAKEISKNLNGITKGFKNDEIQEILKRMISEKYPIKLEKTKYVNDSKITDHYAIIPTGQGYENFDKLSELHKQIYMLIVKRFLSIFYPPTEYNKVSVTINIENEMFYSSGKVCVKKGYLEVAKKETENAEENKNEDIQNIDILNVLKKRQIIDINDFKIKEAETSQPTRYNSGSIILAMENAGKLIEDEELREQIKGTGIGTSATRAEIIKKLERIDYININSKTQIITPTTKGEVIYGVVKLSLPDMLNPKLTASWEKGLEMVAKKEIESQEFMGKLENYIGSKIKKLVVNL
jgi:DNA topoisomerase-3